MNMVNLNKFKKVFFSFENEPELNMNGCKLLEKTFVSNNNTINENRSFVLEFVLPSHASSYSVLGAKYFPSAEKSNLSLEVYYVDNKDENYTNANVLYKNDIYKGLNCAYSQVVLNTAVEFFEKNEIPNGKIIFDSAAYCEFGSSPLLFKIATKAVLHLLLSKQYPVSNETIQEVCEEYLTERSVKK